MPDPAWRWWAFWRPKTWRVPQIVGTAVRIDPHEPVASFYVGRVLIGTQTGYAARIVESAGDSVFCETLFDLDGPAVII
jgi:hypothetical protein